jgi:acetyl esterase
MNDMEKDSLNFQASPFVYDGDMSHVPDAFVLVAQLDPLRDEGNDFCNKLREHKINVTQHAYEATHGFFDMDMKEARRAHDDIVAVLRGVFYESAEKKFVQIDL